MQRLERDDELGGRTIGVGDDVQRAETLDGVRVHFRHDQGHLRIIAPGRRVVDHDAALTTDLRRPFLGDRAAGGHQADVGVGEIIGREIAHLEHAVAIGDFLADRLARGQRHDFRCRKAALFENVEHFAPDIAGCACDCDLETHCFVLRPHRPRSLIQGRRTSSPASFRGQGKRGRGQTVVLVVLRVALRRVAAAESRACGCAKVSSPTRSLNDRPKERTARTRLCCIAKTPFRRAVWRSRCKESIPDLRRGWVRAGLRA